MKDNHMPELKPCPFCGHTPIIDSYGPDALIIQCHCGASVGIRRSGSTLTKVWNTRAESDLLGECLDALSNCIDFLDYIRRVTKDWIQPVEWGPESNIEEARAILAKRKGEGDEKE